MKSTKKKAVQSKRTNEIFAQNKVWTPEKLHDYRQYQTKFMKESYRTFVLRCLRVQEKPMVEWLESQDNLSSYLRELIENDMISKGMEPRLSEEEVAIILEQRELEKDLIKEAEKEVVSEPKKTEEKEKKDKKGKKDKKDKKDKKKDKKDKKEKSK